MIITGQVFDAAGNVIPYASISNKTTGSGTTANAFGQFSVSANFNDDFLVSSVGYYPQTFKVINNLPVQINLLLNDGTQVMQDLVIPAKSKTNWLGIILGASIAGAIAAVVVSKNNKSKTVKAKI